MEGGLPLLRAQLPRQPLMLLIMLQLRPILDVLQVGLAYAIHELQLRATWRQQMGSEGNELRLKRINHNYHVMKRANIFVCVLSWRLVVCYGQV